MTGSWGNSTTLVLTFSFTQHAGAWDWAPWRVGSLAVAVLPTGNLTSANGESAPSNATRVVGEGSWGDVPRTDLQAKSSSTVVIALQPPLAAAPLVSTSFVCVRSHC